MQYIWSKITIKVQLFWRLPYDNVTLLKNEPFMSYQRFKKGGRVAEKSVFRKKCAKIAIIRKLFSKNWIFRDSSTFFELPITQKRFIFEESYISIW